MTLQQLEHFVSAATHLNLTKAAEELYTHHSTISRSISTLERELDTTLMLRSSHGMELTETGRLLYERAQRILEEVELAKSDIKNLNKPYRRSLKIAMGSIHYDKFFSYYQRMRREHDKVEFQLLPQHPDDIYDHILDGTIDLGLTFSYSYTPNNRVFFFPLEKGSFYAYLAPSHRLADKRILTEEDLREENLIFSGRWAHEFFAKSNPNLGSHMEIVRGDAASLEELAIRTRTGETIAIMPEHTANNILPGCRPVEIYSRKNNYSVGLLYATDNTNPVLKNFLRNYGVS